MDLRAVYIQDVMPIDSVELTGTDPRMARISGSDFNSASMVMINRSISPFFSIPSKTLLIAEVPASEANEIVQDVVVLSSRFTATDRSLISMTIGNHPQYLDGLLHLIQSFIKVLLRNPGSDIFQPSIGAGMGSMIARYLQGSQDVTPSDIALAVTRAERQIVRMQARNPDLADAERLASAQLLGVTLSATTGALVTQIELVSQAGERAVSELEY